MKRFFNLLFLATLWNGTTPASSVTYTDAYGIEHVKNERGTLRDYVQNCCSCLIGHMFIQYSSDDRNALYDRIINDLLQSQFCYQATFDKQYVDAIVHKWLIDFAARKTRAYVLDEGHDDTYAQHVSHKVHERIAAQVRWSVWYGPDCKFGLPKGFFEEFLGAFNIQQQIHSVEREINRSRYWTELIGDAWDYFFGYNEQPEHPQVPEYRPEPSAPPAEDFDRLAPGASRLYPTEECGASCFTHFKDDKANRVFLHCGHNYCADCVEGWFFTQGKETCPQCREILFDHEKERIKKVLQNMYGYCAGCNGYNTYMKTLSCFHKLCYQCELAWTDTANSFCNECPRCSVPFRFL